MGMGIIGLFIMFGHSRKMLGSECYLQLQKNTQSSSEGSLRPDKTLVLELSNG